MTGRMTTKPSVVLLKPDLSCSSVQPISYTSQQNNVKVALYARVSLDERFGDKRYQEVENQLVPLREFAHALGYSVYGEFVDHKSGKDGNRPEFKRMMQEAMLRRFNGILVWKLDRFSREGISMVFSYIQKLRDRRIWLRSLTDSWLDTGNEGVTDLVLSVMAWAASEERRKISERTKAGIARRRAIGQWHGGRPKKKGGCHDG